ncbi:MAG: carboxypeptidase regulatory-like domain-containing protein, partial [Candidatus Aminicenantes bacterium]|nr:carboxypeptidase regulatory-like domain-containing protein [Candidatus Aminicenantes bacterium]
MKKIIVMTAAMMMLSASVFAQKENAGIYGTVKQSGSTAISEVTVTLTGDIAGEKSTSTTTAGNFKFPDLPPGTYQLKFEKQGFKT